MEFGAPFFIPGLAQAAEAEGPFDPTGRLRTTQGFAMVAATIAGSRVSFAKLCVKTLVLVPQASEAAYRWHLAMVDYPLATIIASLTQGSEGANCVWRVIRSGAEVKCRVKVLAAYSLELSRKSGCGFSSLNAPSDPGCFMLCGGSGIMAVLLRNATVRELA
jgi:hypothetical protein